VADVQADQEVGQRSLPGHVDGRLEVGDGGLAETLELAHAVPVDGEDVTDVVHQTEIEEQTHPLLAEALDVHGAAGGEVLDRAGELERALEVDTPGVALALGPHQRAVQRAGTLGGERPRLGVGRPVGQHGTDDLGDDVTGPAHDHRVARPHVLDADLVLVVEGGLADVGPADEHRLELGERRGPAGATDGDLDGVELRGALLGRELVRDRPPRRP
jgi:hypothetical protein